MIGLRSLLVGMSFVLSAPALGQAPAPTPHPAACARTHFEAF